MRIGDLPLIPDGDEGREWAERELADPRFAAAEPTPLDLLARAVNDLIGSLFGAQAPAGLAPAVLVGLAVLAIALIVIAFVIWGRPRVSHRADATVPLFGEDTVRSASDLRREASEAARLGEWDAAIVLRFRALARAAIERGVVPGRPGETAQSFARSAARAFPGLAQPLTRAASLFDDVRYLRRPGSAADYEQVSATDEALDASVAAEAAARHRREQRESMTVTSQS